jgi:GAF domain-containing protein
VLRATKWRRNGQPQRRSRNEDENLIVNDGPRAGDDSSVESDHEQDRVVDSSRAAEDEDLRRSVVSLGHLSLRELALEDLLTRVAACAVQAIPGADGAGLTLLEHGRTNTVVATDPFVTEIDRIQYSLQQGPCVSAATEGMTMRSGSLGADPRWPQFGGRIARLGVHSVVSLPLMTNDGVVGAMNVYAHGKHVFDERAAGLGEVFAAPAAIAVQNAQLLADARRLVARMQTALDSRSAVDRAVGIMMSRSGGTPDEALDRLRVLSQNEHHKLSTVAEQIVQEAARRAQARNGKEG